MVESIVSVTLFGWAITLTGTAPLACAVPVPSAFGYAIAVTVAFPTGTPWKEAVASLPVGGRGTRVESKVSRLFPTEIRMPLEATGISLVRGGQIIRNDTIPDGFEEPPPHETSRNAPNIQVVILISVFIIGI